MLAHDGFPWLGVRVGARVSASSAHLLPTSWQRSRHVDYLLWTGLSSFKRSRILCTHKRDEIIVASTRSSDAESWWTKTTASHRKLGVHWLIHFTVISCVSKLCSAYACL